MTCQIRGEAPTAALHHVDGPKNEDSSRTTKQPEGPSMAHTSKPVNPGSYLESNAQLTVWWAPLRSGHLSNSVHNSAHCTHFILA